MSDTEDDEQARIWEVLYARIREVLGGYGQENYLGQADYWVLDDNWGPPQHQVFFSSLHMLGPAIVTQLQGLLSDHPGWEIVIAVSVPGPGDAWPDMGLTIRSHEIVDGLQRQYFPPEYRGFRYPGARPATAPG